MISSEKERVVVLVVNCIARNIVNLHIYILIFILNIYCSTVSIGYVSSTNLISQTAHKNWSKCSCAGNMFLGQREGRILASTFQKTAFSGDVISF
jgi:hypothetical protein